MTDSAQTNKVTVVDVHSHLYPSFHFNLLKPRTTAPYVKDNNKFVNYASAAGSGKPTVPVLYDVSMKVKFMDLHGIDSTFSYRLYQCPDQLKATPLRPMTCKRGFESLKPTTRRGFPARSTLWQTLCGLIRPNTS